MINDYWQAMKMQQGRVKVNQITFVHYGLFIRILKWALLFLAMLMLIGFFIFLKSDAIHSGLIFAGNDIVKLSSGQKITHPHFSGVTQSGDAFSVFATEAVSDSPWVRTINLLRPDAEVNFAQGYNIHAQAEQGIIDINSKKLIFKQDVIFATSDGFLARSDKIIIDFQNRNIASPQEILLTMPMGSLTAGAMNLSYQIDSVSGKSNFILLFTNGVKFLYKSPVYSLGIR